MTKTISLNRITLISNKHRVDLLVEGLYCCRRDVCVYKERFVYLIIITFLLPGCIVQLHHSMDEMDMA